LPRTPTTPRDRCSQRSGPVKKSLRMSAGTGNVRGGEGRAVGPGPCWFPSFPGS
jgi:hypothetical protein